MRNTKAIPLMDMGLFYAQQSCKSMSNETCDKVKEVLHNMLFHKMKPAECRIIMKLLIGSYEAIDKIEDILKVEPGPPNDEANSETKTLKKTRAWNKVEDKRLLCAIHKYGLNDWRNVSLFVGNGRTKAQCYQRWYRTLNPYISKDPWSQEDDKKLLHCVEMYGDHSWTKVSEVIKTRTDVQCRYRYNMLTKKNHITSTDDHDDMIQTEITCDTCEKSNEKNAKPNRIKENVNDVSNKIDILWKTIFEEEEFDNKAFLFDSMPL